MTPQEQEQREQPTPFVCCCMLLDFFGCNLGGPSLR